MSTVKKKIKVLNAIYLEDTECFLILGECENGRLTPQIHRRALLPNLDFEHLPTIISESELNEEMNKFAGMIIGREIEMIFDPDGTIRS